MVNKLQLIWETQAHRILSMSHRTFTKNFPVRAGLDHKYFRLTEGRQAFALSDIIITKKKEKILHVTEEDWVKWAT